jgi:hypothetical protein
MKHADPVNLGHGSILSIELRIILHLNNPDQITDPGISSRENSGIVASNIQKDL